MTSHHEDATSKVETPQESWTDDLLLIAMSESSLSLIHRVAADVGFRIFFKRWEVRMDRQVELMCRFPPANAVGIDNVLSELWMRVYNSAGTYCDGGLEGEARDRRTFKWLKRIAKNALLTFQGDYDRLKLCEIPDEEIVPSAPIPANLLGNNPRALAVAECLRCLTLREADVLRTSADYLGAESQADALPSHIRDALCAKYGTTPVYLRQIRTRALKKLKACAEVRFRTLDQRG